MDDPQSRSIESIQRLLAELDYPTLTVLLYARAHCNEPLPIDLVCEVISRADTLPASFVLFLIADGDRVGAVVNMLETDAFPHDAIGMMFTAAFVLAADKLDVSHKSRPHLAMGVRVLARACLELPPSDLRTHIITAFQLVAAQLEDAILTGMLPSTISSAPPADIMAAQHFLQLSREELLLLPRLYERNPHPSARKLEEIVTFAPIPPRNAPCWCQSGKKFKRCHGADERPTRSREELAARSHRTLTASEVQTWPLRDLATMRFHQFSDESLAAAIDRLLKYRAWDITERALDALDSREHLGGKARDQLRNLLVSRAVQCRRWDLVAKHAKKFCSPRFSKMKANVELLMPVIERAPDAIDHLLRFAERAVHAPKGSVNGGIALLLHAMPALGILLLRAEFASGTVETERDEFIALDQARVRIGLPPGDPAEAMFNQWQEAKTRAREAEAQARRMAEAQAENEALCRQLSEANRQNRDLLRRIDDLERQLREQIAAPIVVEAVPDPAELRALRAKIEQLQGIVRDKNLELVKLRRAIGPARS